MKEVTINDFRKSKHFSYIYIMYFCNDWRDLPESLMYFIISECIDFLYHYIFDLVESGFFFVVNGEKKQSII